MRLIHAIALASVAFAVAATTTMAPPAATAQTASAPTSQPARFSAIVTAISGTQITATGADGAPMTINVAPDAAIIEGRPIQASEIHPGDFVATANVNNADGTGTSTELRVFPRGMRLGEGNYPMQAPNTTMTNATVAQVTNVSGGRQLTVSYGASAGNNSPAGTRVITLPASVQVVQWYRVPLTDIHVGNRVRGRGMTDHGAVTADFVFADDPPAAATH